MMDKYTDPSYIPNDPWAICDISGIKVRMSQTRKTWDGYRVWIPYWYPKHPQLSVRGIPDHMEVYDARPRPEDVFLPFYPGAIYLRSPNGTNFIVYVDDDGTLFVVPGVFPNTSLYYNLEMWRITVDDDGALHVNASLTHGAAFWNLLSPNYISYTVTVDTDAALLVTTTP
jgi:hypothetical protein